MALPTGSSARDVPDASDSSDGKGGATGGASRLGLAAWCAYDWANSSFPTVITTFVFAAYFAKAVAVDDVTGTSQWA